MNSPELYAKFIHLSSYGTYNQSSDVPITEEYVNYYINELGKTFNLEEISMILSEEYSNLEEGLQRRLSRWFSYNFGGLKQQHLDKIKNHTDWWNNRSMNTMSKEGEASDAAFSIGKKAKKSRSLATKALRNKNYEDFETHDTNAKSLYKEKHELDQKYKNLNKTREKQRNAWRRWADTVKVKDPEVRKVWGRPVPPESWFNAYAKTEKFMGGPKSKLKRLLNVTNSVQRENTEEINSLIEEMIENNFTSDEIVTALTEDNYSEDLALKLYSWLEQDETPINEEISIFSPEEIDYINRIMNNG